MEHPTDSVCASSEKKFFGANSGVFESIATEAFAARPGVQQKVHEVLSIATTHEARRQCVDSTDAHASEVDIAFRQFFRPYVLIFLALAVLVGGWSYGYKLTQYLHHSEVSRASYSRIWVDHRNASVVAPSQHRILPKQDRGTETSQSIAPRDSRCSHDLVTVDSSAARKAFVFSSLIPFRAPPSTTPSLA